MHINRTTFLDVGASYWELKREIDSAINRVLQSGQYIGGPEVMEFEAEYARYVGASYCVGVGNGLDALHLALRAMGVGSGDEVIVPSNTYIATWLAATHSLASVVPVEPDPKTYNLDAQRIENAITPRTKVVIPVHLYGQPANLDDIIHIARKHHLYVLEDAAQAHGSQYKGQRIGAHGDIVAWSFYPGKNLGAFGDAGAITTNDRVLAERVHMLGNYGSMVKYVNPIQGYNSRMDPLQAAVLKVKLRHLDEWNSRRSSIAAAYLEALAHAPVVLPHVMSSATPCWHVFAVRSQSRDRLVECLERSGIQTIIHYPIPPHLQTAYSPLALGKGSFPISEEIHKTIFSLPIGPHMRECDVESVITAVLACG